MIRDLAALTADGLADWLAAWRFRFWTEAELQEAIVTALRADGIPFEREVRLGDVGRIDFVVGGRAPGGLGIGLEVKTGGSLADLTRQLHRYAGDQGIRSLVLATTRQAHQFDGLWLDGKPARCVVLSGSFG